MSGIFGIIRKDGSPVSSESLEAMRCALEHWGPDGGGVWLGGACGFGHVLMINTPESRQERQPHTDPALPGLMITADSRLDNREDLLAALGIPLVERPSLSDDAIILRAFARWGEECVKQFTGAFAFVVWDERQQSLFCARDHLGCRPLLYFDGQDQFVFATDVSAILAVKGVPRQRDELAVAAMRQPAYHYLRQHTCFQEILKLPPATHMWVRAGGVRREPYWFPERIPTLRLKSVTDYAEALGSQLRDVVEAHLRTVHPVGSHLSGGLDSSSVTALAAQQLRASGTALTAAYSWSPPPELDPLVEGDERRLIDLVCRQEGVVCRFATLTVEGMLAYWNRDVATQPYQTLEHEVSICPQATADGVGVMLSGWGGDEFISFTGSLFYANQFWRGRWGTMLREAKLEFPGSFPRAVRAILHQVGDTALPMWLRTLFGQDIAPGIRSFLKKYPDARKQILPEEWDLAKDEWRRWRAKPDVRATMLNRLRMGHLEHRMTEWAHEGVHHGIEYRYPLLDRRLVEFAFKLPPEMFWQQGWNRFLFRHAVKDMIPEEVCWNRSKAEPRKWATQSEVFRAAMRQMFRDPRILPDSPLGRFVRLRLRLFEHTGEFRH